MRCYLVTYRLRNGARNTLHLIARSSCDAVITVMDLFGEQLRVCSARMPPASPPQ
jgi:hypothetical protein